ncbi:MAG: AbrB family transcriptional regulator [Firmicutes bacterium]|nr:AbrB family transcriptional regulator [Bacillota bacterium]
MISQKLRKVGNSSVVTVPREEVAALGLREGQLVAVEIRRVQVLPELAPEVAVQVEASMRQNLAGLQYLAEVDRTGRPAAPSPVRE